MTAAAIRPGRRFEVTNVGGVSEIVPAQEDGDALRLLPNKPLADETA